MAGDTMAQYERAISRKAVVCQTARGALIWKVRAFVEAHGHHGSKTGREDYSTMIPLSEIEPLVVALNEYDRVRRLPLDHFRTPEADDAKG